MDEEECPICGVMVDLGEREPCEHYLGFIWDGDISWHYEGDAPKELEKLQKAWSEVDGYDWRRAFEEEIEKKFMSVVKGVAGQRNFEQKLSESFDDSADFRDVVDLVGIVHGEHTITGGMIGGGGQSYFIGDLKKVYEAKAFFEETLIALRKHLPEPAEP